MRYNIIKRNSTKSERIIYEILKELHIDFKHRWLVGGREVDFVFKNIALEIDGHEQNVEKNKKMVECGYIPIHISNDEIKSKEQLKELIIKIIK